MIKFSDNKFAWALTAILLFLIAFPAIADTTLVRIRWYNDGDTPPDFAFGDGDNIARSGVECEFTGDIDDYINYIQLSTGWIEDNVIFDTSVSILGKDGVDVTGTGTAVNPFQISADASDLTGNGIGEFENNFFFQSTDIGTTTWAGGAPATWTFNASGGTDPTVTFGDDVVTWAVANWGTDGSIFLTEIAAAIADIAGRGQLWIKNTDPCELWFTDDAGTDFQLGVGGGGTPGGDNKDVQYNDSGSFAGEDDFDFDTTNKCLMIGPGLTTSAGINLKLAEGLDANGGATFGDDVTVGSGDITTDQEIRSRGIADQGVYDMQGYSTYIGDDLYVVDDITCLDDIQCDLVGMLDNQGAGSDGYIKFSAADIGTSGEFVWPLGAVGEFAQIISESLGVYDIDWIAVDYSVITAADAATDVLATEFEELTDGSNTALHVHDIYALDTDLSTHEADTSTHGAADIADVSDIAIDGNLSAAAQAAITASHAESHTVASHNDTTATGTELETLTDGSDADSLHTHSALIHSKGITLESPTSSEDVGVFFTDEAITITQMACVLVGSLTPSVTWTVRFGADRSAAGTEVVTGGTTTTSVTTGSIVTSFDDATIPADNWLKFVTTAQSGTVGQLTLTVYFTHD